MRPAVAALISYAATHLRVMSLKDPEGFPSTDVSDAVERMLALVTFPWEAKADRLIFLFAACLLSGFIGYVLGGGQ